MLYNRHESQLKYTALKIIKIIEQEKLYQSITIIRLLANAQ